MKVALVAVALLLMSLAAESAEDPETIVKRMRDDAGECHYVLSICSDTVRAEAALAKLRSDPHTDPERLTAAEE